MEDLFQDFRAAKSCIWRVIEHKSIEYIDAMEEQIYKVIDFISSVIDASESPIFLQQNVQLFKSELSRMTEDKSSRLLVLGRLSQIDFPERFSSDVKKYDISIAMEDLK